MENYKEYKSKLFEAFMDAEYPQKEVEYEEVEVEPIFLISEDEELTEENTAVIIEDDEISEELLEALKSNEKYADFKGHQVVVDKRTGVVQDGQFKGKKVNLVRDRQRHIKGIYKDVDDTLGIKQNTGDLLNTAWEKKNRSFFNFYRKRDDEDSKRIAKDLSKELKELPQKRRDVANRIGKIAKYYINKKRQILAKTERDYRKKYKKIDYETLRKDGITYDRSAPLSKKVADL